MKVEEVKEKWYTLRRFHCKEGFIDAYQGDSHHDPDLDEKPRVQVNRIITLYRLNGKGKWHNRNQLKGLFDVLLSDEQRELFTAEELWKSEFIKLFRRTTGLGPNNALDFINSLKNFENFEEKAMDYYKSNVSKTPIVYLDKK
jgi:hypothetical protein